ncbi:hypothetical protein [Microvirga yunnanensis]|uniref:hypothetical protein n=1 Tax=Microvirga yunnanensis TaxID=2953740 RepID=UPI0021C669B8|nr:MULTISPECIES: hypothetical protein [unclassified Microvirga]
MSSIKRLSQVVAGSVAVCLCAIKEIGIEGRATGASIRLIPLFSSSSKSMLSAQ